MQSISFQSHNLAVDYITFKFQHLDDFKKIKIADYLFKIGFNSYQESGKLTKPIKDPILVNPKNKYEILFVIDNDHWDGTLLHFRGSNSACFYSLFRKKLINWDIFSDATLGRVDLVYSRTNKREDKTSVYEFFESCQQKLRQSKQNVSLEKNSSGLILKIGNRRSNHYFRIYEGKNSLRFEYEMKGKFLQKYHRLLVDNRVEEFENKLVNQFLSYSSKLFSLHYPYLDWLVLKLRPTRYSSISSSFLNTDYIKLNR
jgi:hypothetical protein